MPQGEGPLAGGTHQPQMKRLEDLGPTLCRGTLWSLIKFLPTTINKYSDMKADLVVVGYMEGLAGCILHWCLAIGYKKQSIYILILECCG